jgi:hypothetical protein
MTLDEYRRTEDSNAFWRLSSGERQALLDEAIEQIEQYEAAIVPALRELVDAGQQYARASHINEFADIDARNARVGDLLHAHGLDRGDVSLWSATNPCVYQIHLDEEGDA